MARTARDIADQVCIDIPPALWTAQVAFWRSATHRILQQGLRPEFAFLGDPDPAGPARILLRRLDAPAPTLDAHLDLATGDRQQSISRHLTLGAHVLSTHAEWTVMTSPGGLTYCLTDRDPHTGRVRRHPGPRSTTESPDVDASIVRVSALSLRESRFGT